MMLQSSILASIWPLMLAFFIFINFISVLIFIKYKLFMICIISVIMLIVVCTMWFRDLTREALCMGFYNNFMQNSFKIGMILFIFSEIMFFVSVFWSYMHYMFMPMGDLGLNWPPYGFNMINILSVPLLNTTLLLSSGFTVTLGHSFKMLMDFYKTMLFLMLTVALGLIFTLCQIMEYYYLEITWTESIYGALFYLGTGFHGFHVIIGTLMLIINLMMMGFNIMNTKGTFFDLSSWYWHFVDVVWIILFWLFYWWVS